MNRNGNGPDLHPTADPGSEPTVDAAIARALGRKPAIAVPDSFASQVTQRAFAQAPTRRLQWIGWGPRLALGSAAVLTAGMFALAPRASPSLSSVAFDGELLLLAELSGLLLFSHRLLSRD